MAKVKQTQNHGTHRRTGGAATRGTHRRSSRYYSEDWLAQFGLDTDLVVKAVVMAVASGILAGLLDRLFNLPADNVAITLGSLVGVLNGLTYASMKRCADWACLAMGIVVGWMAYFVWYLTLQVVAGDSSLIAGQNWFEATITGLVAGLIGFGWYAILRALPARLTL